MEDSNIIDLYFERSEEAISETDKKYGKLCRQTAFSILENNEDVEECLNDSYLSLWRSIPPQRPEFFRAYILKTVRNFSLKKLEASFAEKRGGGKISVLTDELNEIIPDSEFSTVIDSIAVKEALNIFLRRLSSEKQCIFVRRYFYMSTVEDIAKEYGISESKVKTTLFRLRAELKESLKKEGVIV